VAPGRREGRRKGGRKGKQEDRGGNIKIMGDRWEE
jgi:hypothetical protein